jgi:hypothetical protein
MPPAWSCLSITHLHLYQIFVNTVHHVCRYVALFPNRILHNWLTNIPAQKRLTQVTGHLAGSNSTITPSKSQSNSGGRAKLLEKHPDDVGTSQIKANVAAVLTGVIDCCNSMPTDSIHERRQRRLQGYRCS